MQNNAITHVNNKRGYTQSCLAQMPLENSIASMVFYPTIGRQYFVKTQTYVALFGPRDLSQIFSNGMYIEVSPL